MARLRRLDVGRLAILAVVVLVAVAVVTRDQWDWLLEDGSVRSDDATAEELAIDDDATERLYRIGDGSEVTYRVDERLAGQDSTAIGVTSSVAGDIVVDTVDVTASRVGEIVVNVEMFTSDNSLRDKRIRLDYLESQDFPFARFATTDIEGLPAEVTDGSTHPLTLRGDLTVKETTAPAVFSGDVTVDGDVLTATMSTTVLMSDYDVGPIHIAGLAHTGDEVEIGFDLVAARVAAGSSPTPVDEFAGVAAPPEGEFAGTVQPILERNCVSCHGEGGPGWADLALDTAGDAAEVADGLALVTEARFMPPWPAGNDSLEFLHDWSLSDEEIAAIGEWAAAGGGLDVAADTPLVGNPDQLRHVEVDARGRTQPYAGSTDVTNDYRCRVVEVGDPADERWIQAFELQPDNLDVTHHALIFTAPGSSREEVARLEADDPQEGWSCFGLAGVSGSQLVAGWAPGTQPFELPEDAGLRLAEGDFMIVQIHYHYEDSAPPDAPTLLVDFADDDDIAAAGGSLRPLNYEIYLAPAEIPCTPDEQGPLCERAAVLEEVSEKYGGFAAGIPNGLLLQCGRTLDDFIDDTDGVVTSTCDFDVSNPGEIVSLWGHMHEFGAEYTMTLNPGRPDEQVLLDIPTWSFEWQFGYTPVETFVLEPGDELRISCTWDRSLSSQPEPRYITWNEGTEDEMCWTSVATVPAATDR